MAFTKADIPLTEIRDRFSGYDVNVYRNDFLCNETVEFKKRVLGSQFCYQTTVENIQRGAFRKEDLDKIMNAEISKIVEKESGLKMDKRYMMMGGLGNSLSPYNDPYAYEKHRQMMEMQQQADNTAREAAKKKTKEVTKSKKMLIVIKTKKG